MQIASVCITFFKKVRWNHSGKQNQGYNRWNWRWYDQTVQALEGINKNIKNTQIQLKDLEKLLKLDPKNTELLSQKQKLLADSISATKDKLATLKTATEQANTALANGDITQQQHDSLQRKIV